MMDIIDLLLRQMLMWSVVKFLHIDYFPSTINQTKSDTSAPYHQE